MRFPAIFCRIGMKFVRNMFRQSGRIRPEWSNGTMR